MQNLLKDEDCFNYLYKEHFGDCCFDDHDDIMYDDDFFFRHRPPAIDPAILLSKTSFTLQADKPKIHKPPKPKNSHLQTYAKKVVLPKNNCILQEFAKIAAKNCPTKPKPKARIKSSRRKKRDYQRQPKIVCKEVALPKNTQIVDEDGFTLIKSKKPQKNKNPQDEFAIEINNGYTYLADSNTESASSTESDESCEDEIQIPIKVPVKLGKVVKNKFKTVALTETKRVLKCHKATQTDDIYYLEMTLQNAALKVINNYMQYYLRKKAYYTGKIFLQNYEVDNAVPLYIFDVKFGDTFNKNYALFFDDFFKPTMIDDWNGIIDEFTETFNITNPITTVDPSYEVVFIESNKYTSSKNYLIEKCFLHRAVTRIEEPRFDCFEKFLYSKPFVIFFKRSLICDNYMFNSLLFDLKTSNTAQLKYQVNMLYKIIQKIPIKLQPRFSHRYLLAEEFDVDNCVPEKNNTVLGNVMKFFITANFLCIYAFSLFHIFNNHIINSK